MRLCSCRITDVGNLRQDRNVELCLKRACIANRLVEVFASNNGTSWTIVVTRPDGLSCIVAVGEDWETLPNPVSQPLA